MFYGYELTEKAQHMRWFKKYSMHNNELQEMKVTG